MALRDEVSFCFFLAAYASELWGRMADLVLDLELFRAGECYKFESSVMNPTDWAWCSFFYSNIFIFKLLE